MSLTTKLDDFLARRGPRSNPPASSREDALSAFLRHLAARRELTGLTEDDWVEAGRSQGLDDDEIAQWIEEAAGWVADTSREVPGPEAASWTGLSQKRRRR